MSFQTTEIELVEQQALSKVRQDSPKHFVIHVWPCYALIGCLAVLDLVFIILETVKGCVHKSAKTTKEKDRARTNMDRVCLQTLNMMSLISGCWQAGPCKSPDLSLGKEDMKFFSTATVWMESFRI